MQTMDRRSKEVASPPADRLLRGAPASFPKVLDRSVRDSYEFVILGAGCAGLSLCYYLLEEEVDDPVLILDRKSCFEDDRTWCFWDVEPTPFTHLALREWRSWGFASSGGSATQTTRRYPYKCLAGRDFYEHVLDRLAESPNVTVRLNEDVRSYSEKGGEVRVETARRGDPCPARLRRPWLSSPRFPRFRGGAARGDLRAAEVPRTVRPG